MANKAKDPRIKLAAYLGEPVDSLDSPLDGGGDGPHPPDMEALIKRVDGIEADIRDMKRDVGSIKERLAGIEGRLSNMPTTFQVLTWFLGANLGLCALVFAIARVMAPH